MIFSNKTKQKTNSVNLEPKLEADMSLPDKAQPELAPTGQDIGLVKRIGASLKSPFSGINQRLRQKLRATAIERARTRILIAGQTPEALPAETLEVVVREEEDKLKNQIKEKGLLFVVASLGFGWWL